MTLWHLVIREILHRKLTFAIALIAVIVASGVLTAQLTVLSAHDLQTADIMAAKERETAEKMRIMEDDYRKIMKELGFNLLILPKNQSLDNFYGDGYASQFMPEEYVKRLAASNIVTVRHLLPSIEQKIRWPEQANRNIILIGTRGEIPFLHRDPKEPMLVAVPEGKIVLGFELWQSLSLAAGDELSLMGNSFIVDKCHEQRGTRDDITAWVDLAKAQKMLGKEGEINGILALKCICPGNSIEEIRRDISNILPETSVIQMENKVATRARARERAKATADSSLATEKLYRDRLRHERESLASWILPLVILGSVALVGVLAFNNVRERRQEIGVFRALGYRSTQILAVFLVKAALLGFTGALIGTFGGFFFGVMTSEIPESAGMSTLFTPSLMVAILLLSPVLACVASWAPALMAARQDPAEILGEE